MNSAIDNATLGRDLNHLEDLILFYGKAGAIAAADIIDDLTNTTDHDITIKWDGKVALYYGRDDNGVFGMGTIGNWRKGWVTTATDMRDYIKTAGKGEEWRESMGDDLFQTFDYLKASVPKDFRGFVKGDMIYSPILSPKTITANHVQFSPSQVTYGVKLCSPIANRVITTDVGIALHNYYKHWGVDVHTPVNDDTVARLNRGSVFAIGQTFTPRAPSLDRGLTDGLRTTANQIGACADQAIAKRRGLSDVSQILYRFNNQTMRSGGDEINSEALMKWLDTSKVTTTKQGRIKSFHDTSPTKFAAVFELFNQTRVIKQQMIEQLDNMDAPIQAWTQGQRGGEGYVSSRNKIKMVLRTRWRPM